MIGDQDWWSNRDPKDSIEQAATRLRADDEVEAPRVQPLSKAEVIGHLRERAQRSKARDRGGQLELADEANHWRGEG